jgi:hypothetical protein
MKELVDHKNFLISKIKDFIHIRKPVIPLHSKLILECNLSEEEEATNNGRNDAAIISIAENEQNWRIHRYVQTYLNTLDTKAKDSYNVLLKKVGEVNIPNLLKNFNSQKRDQENNNNFESNTGTEIDLQNIFNPYRTNSNTGSILCIFN